MSLITRGLGAGCALMIALCGALPRVPAACLTPTDRASGLMVLRTRQALSDPQGVTTKLTDGYDGLGTYSQSLAIPGASLASQASQLLSSGASIELAAVAPRESTEFGSTAAHSGFQLEFELEYAVAYELSGSTELLAEAPPDLKIADTTVSLTGPDLAISYSAYRDGLDLQWSGDLSPGLYTLALESRASGSVIESSSTSFVGQFQVVIKGDFNIDCQLTADDIDLLGVAVADGQYDSFYDLDRNKLLELEDQRIWVEELKRTYFGDTDLNGEFNSDDLVAVFQAGEYEDGIPDNSTWAEGDWDGDGEFESSDFVLAFQGGGYELGPRSSTAVVPEPSGGLLLLYGLFTAIRRIRGRPTLPRTAA